MDHATPNASLLRREILAGRPVVALLGPADAAAFRVVHEACVVAGAADRLRIVDTAGPTPRTPLTAHHRRIARADWPDAAMDAWVESVDHATDKPFGRPGRRLVPPPPRRRVGRPLPIASGSGAFDPSPEWPLPALDLAEVGAPGTVLVVRGPDGPAFRWLTLVAVERAEAEGRDAPLVLDRAGRLGALTGRLGWSAFRGSADAPVMGPGKALLAATRGLGDFDEAWERLAADFAATLRPADHAGIRYLRAAGRTVFLCPATLEGEEPRDTPILGEVGPDGWPRLTALGEAPPDVDALLREAFLGGTGRPAAASIPVQEGLRPVPRADGGCTLLAFGGEEGRWDAPALAGFLARACDWPRALAASAASRPQVVHRWSRAGDRARRLDFARSWGALADLGPEGLGPAVDAGAPTLPLVAERLGVGIASARRLVGRDRMPLGLDPAPEARRRGTMALPDLVRALGHDRLPPAGDAAEWDAFCESVGLALSPFRAAELDDPPAEAMPALLLPLGPNWRARRARLAPHRDDLFQARDMLRDLRHALARSGIADPDLGPAILGAVTDGGSAMRIVAVSRRWHAHPALALARRGGVPLDTAWPVPFASADLGDGWAASCLGTALALFEEGAAGPDGRGDRGLNHCAGGYGLACAEGRSILVSLRRDGARASTAEIAPVAEPVRDGWALAGRPFALVQHRGHSNAPAPPEAAAALERLRRGLAEGSPAIDAAALERRAYRGVVHPPDDPTLLGLWAPLLPGGLPAAAFPDDEPEAGRAAPRR